MCRVFCLAMLRWIAILLTAMRLPTLPCVLMPTQSLSVAGFRFSCRLARLPNGSVRCHLIPLCGTCVEDRAMLKMLKMAHRTSRHQQYGAAAVEFALIAMLFFTLLFGILEFGRLFYIYNTVQEVTRRAAREAVIRWVDNTSSSPAKSLALFGGSLPAGAEITTANINIEYLTASGGTPSPFPGSAADNIAAC